jgi:hypothetical protein
MLQPKRVSKNGGEAAGSERPDPEALPGGEDLLKYKGMFKEALENLPKEALLDNIKDHNIKDMETLQGNLREIEDGIKNQRYKSTRKKFHISENAVSINANKARAKISKIISMAITYKSEDASPQNRGECVEIAHTTLDECREALQTGFNEFSEVHRLRRKAK